MSGIWIEKILKQPEKPPFVHLQDGTQGRVTVGKGASGLKHKLKSLKPSLVQNYPRLVW